MEGHFRAGESFLLLLRSGGRSTGVESLPERRGNGLENPDSGGVSSPSAEISRDSLDFEILN